MEDFKSLESEAATKSQLTEILFEIDQQKKDISQFMSVSEFKNRIDVITSEIEKKLEMRPTTQYLKSVFQKME